MVQKSNKPKFKRQEQSRYKKLEDKWRKPKGMHSKLRKRKRGKGFRPSIGYGNPESIKGLHPSGFRELHVSNPNDLDAVDKKTHAVRVSSTVGKRKKTEILKKAKKMKITVLNPGVTG